jgi:hypothetical protein
MPPPFEHRTPTKLDSIDEYKHVKQWCELMEPVKANEDDA